MSRKLNLTANATAGRILLALRAGDLPSEIFYERFPNPGDSLMGLIKLNLVNKKGGTKGTTYTITAAGLAACPSRRAAPLVPLHGAGWEDEQ